MTAHPTATGLDVSLDGVDARFATAGGQIEALAGLDLAVDAGSFTAVIGPNGCGKSTLLRVIAGLKAPDVGRVMVGGAQPVAGDGRVGLDFQQPRLVPWRSVIDNVALPMELAGVAPDVRRDRAEAALAQVGLATAARPRRASSRAGWRSAPRSPGAGRRSPGAAARRAVQRARRAHPRGVRRRAPAPLARAAAHRRLRHPQRRRGRRPRRSRRRHDPAAGARRPSREVDLPRPRPSWSPPTRAPRRSRPRSGARSHRSMRSSCDRGPRRPRWGPREANRVGHRQPRGLPRDLEARDRHRRPAGVHPSGTGGRGGARRPGASRPGVLWPHVGVTLLEIVLGFVVGATVAIGVGIALAKSHFVERPCRPTSSPRRRSRSSRSRRCSTSGSAAGSPPSRGLRAHRLLPDRDRHDGRHPLDRPLLDEVFRSLGASSAQRTRLLEIPSALPVIFGGLRVGVTLAVIGAVVAEWASAGDRGRRPHQHRQPGLFDTPLMFVALAVLAIIGLAFYGGVVVVERRSSANERTTDAPIPRRYSHHPRRRVAGGCVSGSDRHGIGRRAAAR